MKFLTKCMLMMVLSLNAYSSCNVKTDIIKRNGNYIYSVGCHKMVGKLVRDEKDRAAQVKLLNESLKLKDLALDLSSKRSDLWQKEAENQYNLLKKHSAWRGYEKWIWFGGGVGLAIVSVWAAGQLK